jgi:hypothetical protein
MDTIVLTNTNAKTEEKSRLRLKLNGAMKLEDSFVCMSDLSMYYSWFNIAEKYGNNKFQYKRLSDSRTFDVVLPDGSYEVKDINDYLYHFMKLKNDAKPDEKHITLTNNIIFYRVAIDVDDKYELIIPAKGLGEVLGFTKGQPIKNNTVNGDSIPQLEKVETVLVHCNLVYNKYRNDTHLLYSFTPDEKFGSLLNIKPNFGQWRNCSKSAEVTEIEVWFTDQDNCPLDIQDPKISVELQIKDKSLKDLF